MPSSVNFKEKGSVSSLHLNNSNEKYIVSVKARKSPFSHIIVFELSVNRTNNVLFISQFLHQCNKDTTEGPWWKILNNIRSTKS